MINPKNYDKNINKKLRKIKHIEISFRHISLQERSRSIEESVEENNSLFCYCPSFVSNRTRFLYFRWKINNFPHIKSLNLLDI